jgi:hypothetical protein
MLICHASMLYILDIIHLFYMIYILVLICKLPNYLTHCPRIVLQLTIAGSPMRMQNLQITSSAVFFIMSSAELFPK